MNRLLFMTALLAVTAIAQITPPRAGFVRDRGGALRPVLGIAGSFVVGDAIEEGVISAGFGKTVGFAKKSTELLVLRAGEIAERADAPVGDALFYLGNSGEIAEIYFPETRELWRVRKSGFEKLADAPPPHSDIAFQSDEISLASGTRLRIPESIRAVEWLSESWVVVRGDSALYAIRVTGDAAVIQLPEAMQ